MEKVLTTLLLSAAAASAVAWLATLMRERGLRPVRRLAAILGRQTKVGRVLLGAAFASAWIIAGAKPGGMRDGDGRDAQDGEDAQNARGAAASAAVSGAQDGEDARGAAADTATEIAAEAAHTLTAEDFARGFVLTRIGTGEAFDFSPPPNATVCADWLAFGAAEDWIYLSLANWALRVGDASASRLRVHSSGWAEALPDCDAAPDATDRAAPAFMPLKAPLCIVPEANWPLVAPAQKPEPEPQGLEPLAPSTSQPLNPSTAQPSLFWHSLTPSNTLVLTWLNALYEHRADGPVSVQAEIRQGGGVDFRYSLPRPAEAADGESSNVLVGVSIDGSGWLTNALPPDATSVRLESGLERRCAGCLETFASRLGGLDPMSCPPGSTNTVWEHIAYTGTPDGAFDVQKSTDAVAVMDVSVSGSGMGVIDIGGVALPLVGRGGSAAHAVQSASASSAASRSSAAAARSAISPMSATTPPSLRVQVPRGQTVPVYVMGDGTLSVSLSSGDFAFGVLPSLARRVLSGWVNFPNATPTPACVHSCGAKSVAVTLPAGQGADALECRWSGQGVRNVPPRSAVIGGLNPRIAASVSYTLSHPLQLFGEASGEQIVRFCPVPPEPRPGEPDPYDPDDDEEDEPEPEPDLPHTEEVECECDREACDGSCRCCPPWKACCGAADPDDYGRAKTNVAHMSGILLVRDPPLFGGPIRLELPGSDPDCCPCPSHARRNVSLALSRGVRVVDADGADFSVATETVDVRVAATEPSRWPGDAFAAFATNGAIHLECAYTALGVGIGKDGVDLAALNALSPGFGLPVPATTNAADAASVRLRTDVLLRGMNVHVAFEGSTAPFALWTPDTEGGGWRRVASSGGGALDVALPAWRRMSGADGHSGPFSTEARVTADGAGTATLVFRVWGVAGGLFVEDEARQPLTALAPCVRADVDHDGRIGASDDAARIAGRPFRFWFNEDRDKGDFVGQVADTAPNARDLKVNGRLDLVNLFPVEVDASPFLKAWGGAAEARLRAWRMPGDGLRFCVLGSGFSSGDALCLASREVKTADGKPLESAALTPLGYDGVALAELAGRPPSEPVALAFEAAGPVCCTEGPELVVSLGGAEVYRERLPVSIDSVRKMYRWYNGRHLSGQKECRATCDGVPENNPDVVHAARRLIFLHGANVSEADAGKWGDALFKRLWLSGSRADFCNVDWRSDIGSPANYHENASNAFAVAAGLAPILNAIPGEKVVMAHSLGNMVVSSMIQDHGFAVSRYLMCNSAVPAEAYDASPSLRAPQLVHPDWDGYPESSWAANWHRLFAADADDDRGRLGWPRRFAKALPVAVNFHSTGDEVLELAPDNDVGVLTGVLGSLSHHSWHKQELFKGRGLFVGAGATDWSGWNVEENWLGVAKVSVAEARLMSDADFRTNTVFLCHPPSMDEPAIPPLVRGAHLALGIPALTPAAGVTSFGGELLSAEMIDMNDGSPHGLERPNGWPRRAEYPDRWLHSDMKDAAYYFVYKFFERVIEKGELR